MKTIFTLGISLFTVVLLSCSSQKSSNTTQKQDSTMTPANVTPVAGPTVGGDQDEHGCRASAGYQWSAIKQECIRPFDLSTKMKDLTRSTLSGYLLFSTDNTQVEVFAAGFKPAIILSAEGTDVYASTDKQYKLKKDSQKHWLLSKTEAGKTTPILQQE